MKIFAKSSSRKKSSPVSSGSSPIRQEHSDYWDLMNRLNKTMYYGARPKTERPSLALTDIAVGKFTLYDHLFPSLESLHMDRASSLSREACISPCSLVLAMVYLDRIGRTNPNFLATTPSSKLFIISVMVASKFLHDEGEEDEVFNDEWANSVNLELAELNQLEREFLTAIDWRLFVDEHEFAETLNQIEKQIALKESAKRGWFSYTDLSVLVENTFVNAILDILASHVITVTLACSAAYVASLLTLLGSAAIVARLPWNQNPTDITTSLSTELSTDFVNLPTPGRLNSSQLAEEAAALEDLNGNILDILNDTDFERVRIGSRPFRYLMYPQLDHNPNETPLSVPNLHLTTDSSPAVLEKKLKLLSCGTLKILSCPVAA